MFCRKRDFETIGGYDESRLVAEDVIFLLAMRRLGRARGQRLARVTSAKAIASTRKFDEFGACISFTLRSSKCRILQERKLIEFTEKYWYKPKR